MTYETVVTDLFERFPKLRLVSDAKFAYMGTERPDAYIIFGSILMPDLEQALESGELASILKICAFLEDIAEAAEEDRGLKSLLQVEVGEWLGGTVHEASLTPWLGARTKQICGYVPGLATQRIALRAEDKRRGLAGRIGSFMTRLRGK
jgi:hypothetical protein